MILIVPTCIYYKGTGSVMSVMEGDKGSCFPKILKKSEELTNAEVGKHMFNRHQTNYFSDFIRREHKKNRRLIRSFTKFREPSIESSTSINLNNSRIELNSNSKTPSRNSSFSRLHTSALKSTSKSRILRRGRKIDKQVFFKVRGDLKSKFFVSQKEFSKLMQKNKSSNFFKRLMMIQKGVFGAEGAVILHRHRFRLSRYHSSNLV